MELLELLLLPGVWVLPFVFLIKKLRNTTYDGVEGIAIDVFWMAIGSVVVYGALAVFICRHLRWS
jgi:hypothetical protein